MKTIKYECRKCGLDMSNSVVDRTICFTCYWNVLSEDERQTDDAGKRF